jgi:AcrR family transcriptional regulator
MRGGESLRDQQKALTRHRIIRAARGCFLSDGIAETSFDDIARRAGVSRATVYLHYARKDALLLGMLEEDWEAQAVLFAALPAKAEGPDDFARWLGQMIAAYGARRESMGLYALVLGQDPGIADLLEVQRRRLLAILGERFACFDLADDPSPAKRVSAYLMLVQIEQFCLMSMRADWGDALDAGINLLACRLAAFVEAEK